ncbi:MAG TPA: oligosaccharide flippase family protein [Ignavibacteria bacterium]|nr:oligosaccharide flippase family protein [Ignavibacteria bacterium]
MIKHYIKKISEGSLLVLILNAVSYAGSFILAVIVSRFLGIEVLGNYSLIFAFVLILGLVSDFGLSTLLVRKLVENKFNAKEIINSFNLIKISLSAVIIIAIFITAFLFYTKIYYPAFFIGIFLILPRTLMSTYEASIRSFLNQKYPVIIKSANSLLQLALSYYFLSAGYGLSAVMLCILIPDIITLLLLMLANNNVVGKFNSESNSGKILKSDQTLKIRFSLILKESSVFFANNFLMLSIKGLNVILLGYFSTAAAVGIYSAGSRFVNGIGLFSGALFNSFYPAITNIKNDLKTKTELTKKFILYSFTLGLMITVPLYLFSGNLMELTFKSDDSVIVMKILSFTMIPVLVYTVTQSFLFSVYNEIFLTRILIIAWSLYIILSIILIKMYGYTGCASALTFTEIFLMITQLLKFKSDINKPVRQVTQLSQ